MPQLPVVSGALAIKWLADRGFVLARSRGSHRMLVRQDPTKKIVVVVPDHRELDIKTLRSIIRQSVSTDEQFLTWFKNR